jgi:hypothetical protein
MMSPAMLGRKGRIDSLLSYVRITRQRRRELVPRFALEWGLSEEKVQEYVRLVLAGGQVQEGKDGMLQLASRIDGLPPAGPGPGRRGRKSPLKGKSS